MRVTRSILLLLAVALAVAGCTHQPVYVAGAPGIDNVVYGQPRSQAYQPPGYAAPRPSYMAAPAPNYAPPPTAYGPPTARGYVTAPSSGYVAPPTSNYVAAPAAGYMAAPARGYMAAPARGYVSTAVPRVAVAAAYVPIVNEGPYTLDSGDRLRIVVFGQDGLTNSYAVDASGHIDMPLIGSVPARAMTTDQLASQIAGQLRDGFIREPHVAVEVEAYRPFFILGEVTAPGQYPYVANMTVETAVAIAGGFGPRGVRDQVTISRNVGGRLFRFAAPIICPVRPGDTIVIPERWF